MSERIRLVRDWGLWRWCGGVLERRGGMDALVVGPALLHTSSQAVARVSPWLSPAFRRPSGMIVYTLPGLGLLYGLWWFAVWCTATPSARYRERRADCYEVVLT